MRRVMVLGVMLAAGALSLVVAGQQPPAAAGQLAPKVVEAEKLRDNLWVLKGGGGNTAVFVGANGVVVVDAKNPGWGGVVLAKIRELTNKPVTTLINRHTHADHVGGNVEFPATVEIVTQENTKAHMENMTPVTGLPAANYPVNLFRDAGNKGLPKKTFKDKMSIGTGNDRIDLFYFGRGHTDGDAWVVFPALRVVHAGDVFSGKNLPLLDANNGGSGVQIADTLEKAASSLKDVDTIITGHSTQMTMADLREYVTFNREFVAAMREATKAGKSVDDTAAGWTLPAKYVGYAPITGGQATRLKTNVQVIFDELK